MTIRRAAPGPLAMALIALFYLCALFVGVGAMTSGRLDPTDCNLSLSLLANSFGDGWLGAISAIFFLAILAAISDIMLASAGNLSLQPPQAPVPSRGVIPLRNYPRVAKGAVFLIVAAAIVLGLLLQKMQIALLFAWSFNVAASANLPALTIGLSWKRATPAGVMASMLAGLVSSLLWIVLSREANFVSLTPFNQPALVTLPLSFLTLVVVSLLVPRK